MAARSRQDDGDKLFDKTRKLLMLGKSTIEPKHLGTCVTAAAGSWSGCFKVAARAKRHALAGMKIEHVRKENPPTNAAVVPALSPAGRPVSPSRQGWPTACVVLQSR